MKLPSSSGRGSGTTAKWNNSQSVCGRGQVSSAKQDVLEGRSVTLTTPQHEDKSTIRDIKWLYNTSVAVVSYFPMHNDLNVHTNYLNKVNFSTADFSLTLKNPQRSDSGVYKAVIEIKDAPIKSAEYELSVLEHAASPNLTVVSNRSSSDSCNVTLRCTGAHVSLNSSCYSTFKSTFCSPEGGGIFLSSSFNHTTVSCNQSNPVSWRQTIIELKPLCPLFEVKPPIPPRTPWWVYLLVTSIILAVFAAVVAFLSFILKTSRNRGGAQNEGNDQTAQVNSPPTEMVPFSRSAGGADNAYDTPGTQAQNGPPPRTIYDTVQSSRMQAPPSPEQTLLQEPMYTEAETVYARVNKPKKGGPD